MEPSERFNGGHDMQTALARPWLASASTRQTGLFRRAVCIGPDVRGAERHGWVVSM
jgi:hypothetical protein